MNHDKIYHALFNIIRIYRSDKINNDFKVNFISRINDYVLDDVIEYIDNNIDTEKFEVLDQNMDNFDKQKRKEREENAN